MKSYPALFAVLAILMTPAGASPAPAKASVTPSIISLSPSSGPVGSNITIIGSGFADRNNVHFDFGGFKEVLSPDGIKLVIPVPAVISGCTFWAYEDHPCSLAPIPVVPGFHQIRVSNSNGATNDAIFTVSQVLGTTTSTAQTVRLVLDNQTVYQVAAGERRGFPSPAVFFSHGYSFDQVRRSGPSDLVLPEGKVLTYRDGTLVKSPADSTVYIISNDEKRPFTSGEVFTKLGYQFSSVLTDASGEVTKFSPGLPIASVNAAHPPGSLVNFNGTICKIIPTGRVCVPSRETFESHGYSFKEVVPANEHDKTLPETARLAPRPPVVPPPPPAPIVAPLPTSTIPVIIPLPPAAPTATSTTATPPSPAPAPAAAAYAVCGEKVKNVPGDYSSIQAAVNAARSGDTVRLAAGTYGESVNMKSGICLEGAGIDQTIITKAGANGIRIYGVSNVIVKNITVKSSGGLAYDGGGIMIGQSSNIRVESCRLTQNTATNGGGLYIGTDSSNVAVSYCLIDNNNVSNGGGGVVVGGFFATGITLQNITVANNAAPARTGGTGGLLNSNYYLTISNSIFWGNTGPIFSGTSGSTNFSNDGTKHTNNYSYSDIGGWLGGGTGNINADPQFVSASDYHLKSTSPAINMGAFPSLAPSSSPTPTPSTSPSPTPTPTPTGTILVPPTSAIASQGTGKINISWSGGTTPKYMIHRSVNGGAYQVWLGFITNSYYDDLDGNLLSGSTYRYKVLGCDSSGYTCSTTGVESNSVTYSGSSLSCTGLSLTLNDGKTTYVVGVDNFVNYTWTCTPGGNASYVAMRLYKPDGSSVLSNTVSGSSPTQTMGIGVDNLTSGTHTLKACFDEMCNIVKASQAFSISTPTPSPAPPPPSPSPSTLTPPTSVTATPGTTSPSIKVSWPVTGAATYPVYRCVADFGCGGALAYSLIITAPSPESLHSVDLSTGYVQDASVSSGTTYRYKVYSCDSSNNCSSTGTESNSAKAN